MKNKYSPRLNGIISRDTDSRDNETKLPSWLENFAKDLQKTSVQSRQQDESTYDQISNILGNKSKFSSVEEAVQDMRRRTGFEAFINAKSEKENNKKIAENVQPALFSELPKVKIFIDNYIQDRPGTAIEAVIHALEQYFSKELSQEHLDDSLRRYIDSKILETKNLNPDDQNNDLNIGKLDKNDSDDISSNSDVFQGCMPAKI